MQKAIKNTTVDEKAPKNGEKSVMPLLSPVAEQAFVKAGVPLTSVEKKEVAGVATNCIKQGDDSLESVCGGLSSSVSSKFKKALPYLKSGLKCVGGAAVVGLLGKMAYDTHKMRVSADKTAENVQHLRDTVGDKIAGEFTAMDLLDDL